MGVDTLTKNLIYQKNKLVRLGWEQKITLQEAFKSLDMFDVNVTLAFWYYNFWLCGFW